MADDLIRMACACGIDGCDCDEAVNEINGNNSLLNSLQQNFQTQQLAQLVGLLVALMQNKGLLQQKGNGRKAKAEQVEAAGGGGDDGHGHGGASSAGSVAGAKDVNGISVVTRMGKQIGARIAQQFDDMVAAAKKDGVTLTITSGFRSRAEQERLYSAYKNGTGNLAARPGTSNHEKGDAIDFGGGQAAYDWLAKNASKFGMHGNVPGEPWHYSLNGN
ncbi:M15 family metallopeptidase [bacterium]|nr:M15 family metallopeptidase [bacterium]